MSENNNRKHSKWLVMVYLAGDNNLSAFSIAFMQQLEAAEYGHHVRVVAGFDSPTPWPKGARYLEIKRYRDPSNPYKGMKWPLHNDLIQPGHIVVSPDFCECEPRRAKAPDEPIAEEALARFLDWVQRYYAADRYMLIVFGHGTLVAGNTFLADTNPPSYLKLTEFCDILEDHFEDKIDILAFDNCVMNGIETAVQLGRKVDYTLGSQGLMLANGWPVKEIIEAVGSHYRREPKYIAEQVLRACARNLLDFALMERSSEQAICDLTKFGKDDALITSVKGLSTKLREGLQFIYIKGEPVLLFPVVRDLVRLARLEAQSYWSETFVDLYDFAALLLDKCNDYVAMLEGMMRSVFPDILEDLTTTVKVYFTPWPLIKILTDIAYWCRQITEVFRCGEIVPYRYYVGPQMQYSNGISIYFPWTLPEGPITFEPENEWEPKPQNYYLMTPFEEYKTYRFASCEYGDWSQFLEAFFRATLRNVRVVEYDYTEDDRNLRFFNKIPRAENERVTPVIDLQKSSSSTGEPDDSDYFQVKNYPRRFYISPADCKRRMDIYGINGKGQPTEAEVTDKPCKVSYLGWNIRGLLAEVVDLPKWNRGNEKDPCA